MSALKYNDKHDNLQSIQEYTNDFKLLAYRLRMAKEKWSTGNLNQEYLQNIQATEGSSIMTTKTLCVAEDIINYKENVDKLLKTALHNNFDQDKHKRGRYRRIPDQYKGDTKSDGATPTIPGHLLELIRKGTGHQLAGLLIKRKKLRNKENRDICPDELRLNNTRESNHSKKNKENSKDGKRGGGNHKNDNKGNNYLKKRCLSLST